MRFQPCVLPNRTSRYMTQTSALLDVGKPFLNFMSPTHTVNLGFSKSHNYPRHARQLASHTGQFMKFCNILCYTAIIYIIFYVQNKLSSSRTHYCKQYTPQRDLVVLEILAHEKFQACPTQDCRLKCSLSCGVVWLCEFEFRALQLSGIPPRTFFNRE